MIVGSTLQTTTSVCHLSGSIPFRQFSAVNIFYSLNLLRVLEGIVQHIPIHIRYILTLCTVGTADGSFGLQTHV
jgi:hypothetical protein